MWHNSSEQGRDLDDNVTVHPQARRDRFDFLCREIDRLIARHSSMPTKRLKSLVSAQINAHLDEIDQMNQAMYLEEMTEREKAVHREPGYFSTSPGIYQALGVGLLLVTLGLIFGVYLMAMLGGVITLLVLTQTTATAPEPQAEPEPPTPARERWQWTP